MLACGTTTCEIKSGYGLSVESELKILRAIARLAREHPLDIVATFLGAHEVPVEFRGRREAYIDLVIDEMIPAVAAERLAGWCDVFCETGVFTPDESARILDGGRCARDCSRGSTPTSSARAADRPSRRRSARARPIISSSSRPTASARWRAPASAATLLPIAAFYLKLGRFAPARALIAAGVPVALATDVNPGRRLLAVDAVRDDARLLRDGT